MDRAFTKLLAANNSIADCIFAASNLPAKTLGLHAVGEIAVGKKAHIHEYKTSEISVVAQ